MTRRKNNPLLLDAADAGTSPAMRLAGTLAHFDEHQGAVAVPHDKVNFTAAAAGCSIIAVRELEPGLAQVGQRERFGNVTAALGGNLAYCDFCANLCAVS